MTAARNQQNGRWFHLIDSNGCRGLWWLNAWLVRWMLGKSPSDCGGLFDRLEIRFDVFCVRALEIRQS